MLAAGLWLAFGGAARAVPVVNQLRGTPKEFQARAVNVARLLAESARAAPDRVAVAAPWNPLHGAPPPFTRIPAAKTAQMSLF